MVGGILFMAWLAGLLHFGKIAPGLTPITGPPPQGRVLVVQETEIPRELEVLGAVISPSLAQVSSQVSGRVVKIWVEAGSRVKSGDPLVTLSAAEFKARVDQATAGLAQARAQLAQVTADYQRYQFLFKEGAVSPQEFDAMQARYQSAKAALAQSQAVVKRGRHPEGLYRGPGAGGRGGGGAQGRGGGSGPARAELWRPCTTRTASRSRARSTTATGSR